MPKLPRRAIRKDGPSLIIESLAFKKQLFACIIFLDAISPERFEILSPKTDKYKLKPMFPVQKKDIGSTLSEILQYTL